MKSAVWKLHRFAIRGTFEIAQSIVRINEYAKYVCETIGKIQALVKHWIAVGSGGKCELRQTSSLLQSLNEFYQWVLLQYRNAQAHLSVRLLALFNAEFFASSLCSHCAGDGGLRTGTNAKEHKETPWNGSANSTKVLSQYSFNSTLTTLSCQHLSYWNAKLAFPQKY